MPEGDTIYRLAERLQSQFAGQVVERVDERRSSLRAGDLTNARFDNAINHGKHLQMRFSNGLTLHSHLKMTGAWTTSRPSANPNVPKLGIQFAQKMLWGVGLPILELYPTAREPYRLQRLGPDLIRTEQRDHDLAAFQHLPLTAALLKQTIAAGLGNIYAVELPYLFGLSPFTPISEIEAPLPIWHLGQALLKANACIGPQTTTGFRHKPLMHHIYGKAGRACLVCRTLIQCQGEAETSWSRLIWWCPTCQPQSATLPQVDRALRLARRHRLALALFRGEESRLRIAQALSPQRRLTFLS